MKIQKGGIKRTLFNIFLVRVYDGLCVYFNKTAFLIRFFFSKFSARIVFFFNDYSTGGGEKCQLDIVRVASGVRTISFFTGYSFNEHFKPSFERFSKCYDVLCFLRKEGFFRWAFKRILISKLNKKRDLIIFGSNSSFFYEIIPQLKMNIKIFDLLHAFTFEDEPGAEKWSLPLVDRIHKRIVINLRTKNDYIEQYRKHNLSPELYDRIQLIRYMIEIPDAYALKDFSGKLIVLYVGRNEPIKRINLIAETAFRCKEDGIEAEFYFIGHDLKGVVEDKHKGNCNFVGVLQDFRQMNEYYTKAHVLMIASSREGFPFTIMEAMAHGVVPVATAVGGIPEQLEHGKTGFLISEVNEERKIVNEAVAVIHKINNNRQMLQNMSRNAYSYARENFSAEIFEREYKKLFQL